MIRGIVIFLFLILLKGQIESSLCKFEGILGNPVENINNMHSNARAFLPYNPVIFEIGAYKGEGTLSLAGDFPHAKIIAFEPHPRSYAALAEKVRAYTHVLPVNLAMNTFNGKASLYVYREDDVTATLLNPCNRFDKTQPSSIEVSCAVLDDWCAQNGIGRIDFLRLDAEGFEYHILRSSPKALKTVLVILTKTYFHKLRSSFVPYEYLKKFLYDNGFILLSHWYKDGEGGEAMFIRKIMYDSVFN